MASFQLKKKNEDPEIQKTVAEDYANHKKSGILFQNSTFSFLTGHILLSQGETSESTKTVNCYFG